MKCITGQLSGTLCESATQRPPADGSMIYGGDAARASALRSFQDGKLLASPMGDVPLNTQGQGRMGWLKFERGEEVFFLKKNSGDV